MAWLTREDARSYSRSPKEPDMETLSYWLARLEPLIRAETEGEIICVFANRTGTEDEAVYAGTSAVLGIHAGEVKVYGILGRGERELLVVDTNKRPQAKLISQPNSVASDAPQSPTLKDPSDSRTNSTVSEKSSLSINSENSAITIPDQLETPKTIDEVVTPLSPVDASSQNAFFAPKIRRAEGETLRDALISSIGHGKEFSPAQPGSPTFKRPASPKSRNASRTRQPDAQQPALIAHDLAQEEQITQRTVGVKSPQLPKSASSSPNELQFGFTGQYFGPRSAHALPRPRSTVW
jgi:protein N-terminal amidase